MKPDKELTKADADKEEKLPSETVENAHASGDGAIERSEEDLAKADRKATENEPPY
jgi:hypothetical protein